MTDKECGKMFPIINAHMMMMLLRCARKTDDGLTGAKGMQKDDSLGLPGHGKTGPLDKKVEVSII